MSDLNNLTWNEKRKTNNYKIWSHLKNTELGEKFHTQLKEINLKIFKFNLTKQMLQKDSLDIKWII